jgi:hypothetical protein
VKTIAFEGTETDALPTAKPERRVTDIDADTDVPTWISYLTFERECRFITGKRMKRMDETSIDRTAMGRLAKALTFICGADHPTTFALNLAAESGSDRDVKKARALFLKLKSGDRNAALAMIDD